MGNFRYATRSLLREWGFALTFVLTLGLGIGANTAIFSLVNGVLLRPLPYPDSERIAYLTQPARARDIDNISFSFTEIADVRDQSATLDEVVEYGDWVFSVLGRGEPHRVTAGLVTANFFRVLGMRALHGRLLTAEDRFPEAPPVVVLSYEYWERVFENDPGVIGQILDLTAKQATIVGVLEPGVHYATARQLDLYANYASNDHYSGASMQNDRSHRMTEVFARLAPGVTFEAAQADLDAITERLSEQFPDDYPPSWEVQLKLTPWRDALVSRARSSLLLLLGTALSVLLIACANVGNLTLTRLVRRDREFAVRRALGATSGSLRRLLFVESLFLAAVGAGMGMWLARIGLESLTAYTARFTSRTGEIGIDFNVLLFTVAVAVGIALVFGLVPPAGSERRLAASLAAGGGHATDSRQRRFVQRLLVVAQVAVCFILLVGAGLLLRTLANLYSIDPGFDMANVLSLEAPKFGDYTVEGQRQFSDQLIEIVGTHPGVESSAVVGSSPLGDQQTFPLQFRTEEMADDAEVATVPTVFETVTPNYFQTLGIPLRRGRTFDSSDNLDSGRVAVISEAMATSYFGDADPVGRALRYSFGGPFSDPHTVIGVVADARLTDVTAEGIHAFYTPQAQAFPGSTVLVRTTGSPGDVTAHVVESIRALDPERPIEEIRTLDELRREAIAPQRLNALLFASFAALAMVIAAVGIAGVLAFSVSQRTREMGIRMAVGSDRRAVVGLVLKDGVLLTVAGILAGLVGAIFVARFLAGLLYGVEPLDPSTYAGVALLLVAVGISGAWIPARRASSVDPIQALRQD